jgi:membrane protein implicated in regulation of membrane protease activity
MIRTQWSIINLLVCGLAALAVLAPQIPVAITLIAPVSFLPTINPYIALLISAAIALVITIVAYRLATKNAQELLTRAEA